MKPFHQARSLVGTTLGGNLQVRSLLSYSQGSATFLAQDGEASLFYDLRVFSTAWVPRNSRQRLRDEYSSLSTDGLCLRSWEEDGKNCLLLRFRRTPLVRSGRVFVLDGHREIALESLHHSNSTMKPGETETSALKVEDEAEFPSLVAAEQRSSPKPRWTNSQKRAKKRVKKSVTVSETQDIPQEPDRAEAGVVSKPLRQEESDIRHADKSDGEINNFSTSGSVVDLPKATKEIPQESGQSEVQLWTQKHDDLRDKGQSTSDNSNASPFGHRNETAKTIWDVIESNIKPKPTRSVSEIIAKFEAAEFRPLSEYEKYMSLLFSNAERYYVQEVYDGLLSVYGETKALMSCRIRFSKPLWQPAVPPRVAVVENVYQGPKSVGQEQSFSLLNQLPIYVPRNMGATPRDTEIRLIKLFPAYMGDSLLCDMFCTSLEQKPTFKALSYPWGNAKMTHTIDVKGHCLSVTANLHQALVDLRDDNDILVLWVDAICINQEDIEERNDQVMKMPKIYSAAQEVIVWLGKGTDATDEVMDQIALPSDTLHKKKPKELPGLNIVFSLKYWRRVWVVQELAAAIRNRRACTLHCGKKSVTLTQFKSYLRQTYRQIKVTTLSSIMKPRDLLSLSTQDPSRSFLDVLWHSAKLQASDPRDRFYGIRGISPKFYRDHINVDYTIEFDRLCAKVIDLIIKKERRIDVLCYFHRYSTKTSSPSWLRDFSKRNGGILADAYSCDGGRKSDAHIANGILRTKGVRIGRATTAMKFNKKDIGPGVELEPIRNAAFSAFQLAEHFSKPADERKENRFLEMFSDGKQRVIDRLGREYLRRWRILWQKRVAFEAGKMGWLEWKRLDDDFSAVFSRMIGRSVFTTPEGKIGLGPGDMQENDLVCILYGCRLPVVLRKLGGSRCFTFIGPAYVDGAMNGELVRESQTVRQFWIR